MRYLDSEMIGKNNANNMLNWHIPLSAEDVNWENNFRLILYQKASDTYFKLGDKCLASRKYNK